MNKTKFKLLVSPLTFVTGVFVWALSSTIQQTCFTDFGVTQVPPPNISFVNTYALDISRMEMARRERKAWLSEQISKGRAIKVAREDAAKMEMDLKHSLIECEDGFTQWRVSIHHQSLMVRGDAAVYVIDKETSEIKSKVTYQ